MRYQQKMCLWTDVGACLPCGKLIKVQTMMNIAVCLAVDKPGCRLVEDNHSLYLEIYYEWYAELHIYNQCR